MRPPRPAATDNRRGPSPQAAENENATLIHYITSNGIGNAWVANELRQVQRADIPFALHAMRKPATAFHKSQWAADIDRGTHEIYPVPKLGLIVSLAAAPFLFGGRFFAAIGNALFAPRETLRGRVAALAHFAVACHWARGLRRQSVSHIHSQWIHSCGTIGFYGAWLAGKPFSFTGHATDLFRDRVALKDKIRRAEFIVCISNFHRDFYIKEGADPAKLHVVYCGIDPTIFTPEPIDTTRDRPFRIRSSGRLVEKKGFAYLVEACRILAERGCDFECVIAGSGPLDADLRRRIADAKLGDRVTMTGAEIKQEEIPGFMRGGDVYVLPCVWASDNDVDGLPQMLMEAMACGLPVISTRLVGVPDLVIDGKTGLLVAPNNAEQLADAIWRLHDEPALAQRLATDGCRFIHEAFDIRTCLEPLLDLYRAKVGMKPTGAAAASPITDSSNVAGARC